MSNAAGSRILVSGTKPTEPKPALRWDRVWEFLHFPRGGRGGEESLLRTSGGGVGDGTEGILNLEMARLTAMQMQNGHGNRTLLDFVGTRPAGLQLAILAFEDVPVRPRVAH
jgi:hypothetical protein